MGGCDVRRLAGLSNQRITKSPSARLSEGDRTQSEVLPTMRSEEHRSRARIASIGRFRFEPEDHRLELTAWRMREPFTKGQKSRRWGHGRKMNLMSRRIGRYQLNSGKRHTMKIAVASDDGLFDFDYSSEKVKELWS